MYTKKEIIEQLDALGAPRGSIVLMHASMRAVGDVEGGAEGLLDTLIEYFTRDGGLFCVPTHTWDNLGRDVPTLDLTRGESNLGLLTEIAARDKRGIRSENPTHSMVVYGDRARAEKLIEGDKTARTPTAPETAYGEIYRQSGYILLVGVAQSRNTFLHTVDEILNIPNRMVATPTKTTVKLDTGAIIERDLCLFDEEYNPDISLRFTKYDTAFRYHRALTDGFIGDAPTMLCSATRMKDVVELIHSRSGGIDPLADEEPIPQAWYVKR